MDNQSTDVEPPRYDVLDGSGVSTLNRLLQCNTNPEAEPAELTLRDPQSGEILHVTIVRVELEHDPVGGAVFFTGVLETEHSITGYVRPTADSDKVVGSAHIQF